MDQKIKCLVKECIKHKKQNSRFCSMHTARYFRTGRLDLKTSKERFLKRIKELDNGCHVYTGQIMQFGYGRLRANGKKILAHRYSWIINFGEIPDNLYILHKCDNRPCVNPKHLFLGTQKENIRDAISKGRINPSERAKKMWAKRKNGNSSM